MASDPEVGVDSISLYRSMGDPSNEQGYEFFSTDGAAPFQFNLAAPVGAVGEQINFRARAVDFDGNESEFSFVKSLTIAANAPPTVKILTPLEGAVVIDGQQIEVVAEALDDLGFSGTDRVVFYLNDEAVFTAYQNDAVNSDTANGAKNFSALIDPPEGVDGFVLQAVACLLYTSPSPRDQRGARMPSSA